MAEKKIDPIRPTDDEARALARRLIDEARFGALAVTLEGAPYVSRIAVATDGTGTPVTLVSDLSDHSRALAADPVAALLLGEPGAKGDPLTHPRVTLRGRMVETDKAALRDRWLQLIPKAALYFDFGDFRMWRLEVADAHLNGGFGRAFRLTPEDLGLG